MRGLATALGPLKGDKDLQPPLAALLVHLHCILPVSGGRLYSSPGANLMRIRGRVASLPYLPTAPWLSRPGPMLGVESTTVHVAKVLELESVAGPCGHTDIMRGSTVRDKISHASMTAGGCAHQGVRSHLTRFPGMGAGPTRPRTESRREVGEARCVAIGGPTCSLRPRPATGCLSCLASTLRGRARRAGSAPCRSSWTPGCSAPQSGVACGESCEPAARAARRECRSSPSGLPPRPRTVPP